MWQLGHSITSCTATILISTILLQICIGISHGDEVFNRILTATTDTDDNSALAQSNLLGETSNKRSWQSLQGSWGKRSDHEGLNSYDDNEYETNVLMNGDRAASSMAEPLDYPDNEALNIQKLANLLRGAMSVSHPMGPISSSEVLMPSLSGEKRAWKSMSGAWGKRLGSGNWNRFRGSWGKREPGWNNLKGLWGKRSTPNSWNKLQSAWGKRAQY